MKLQKIHKTYILSFLFALHIALSAYISSTFLAEILTEKYVGLLFVVASLLALIFLSQSSTVLKMIGNRALTLAFLIANILSLVVLILSRNPTAVAVAFIIFNVTNTLFFFCIDIFIEHFGTPKTIGKTRGLYLTIINLAWMLSPFFTGFLIARSNGYTSIFAISLVTALVTTIGFLIWVPAFKDKIYTKTPFLKTYSFLKTKKHLWSINNINFILQFFFVWMIIYTPLYLAKHIGFNWAEIGIIFTWMLLPFVILGYPIGILIDKFHFHKRVLLVIGIIIMSISTIMLAFIVGQNIIIWSVVLFFTRVGATVVQAVSEIYFFTHVREESADLLSIFRDMTPLSYVIAPLLGTAFLFLFPFKYLFIALGVIVLLGLFSIPHLKHTKHELHLSN